MFDFVVIVTAVIWVIFGIMLTNMMSETFKLYRVEISVVDGKVPNFGVGNITKFKGGYVSCSERECIVGLYDTGDFVFVRFEDERIVFEGFDKHLVEKISKEFVRGVSSDRRD